MARFIRTRETPNFVVFQSDGSDGVPEFQKLYIAKTDEKAKEEELLFEWRNPDE